MLLVVDDDWSALDRVERELCRRYAADYRVEGVHNGAEALRRLEGKAPVGGVAIGAETARRLPQARTEPLGMVELKGKAEPVEAHELIGLDTPRG